MPLSPHCDSAPARHANCLDGPAVMRGHSLYPSPLPLPVDMPRTLQLTDPMFASVLHVTAQVQAQHPVVKGIVCVGKMAFLFEWLHEVQRDLCALLLP